MSTPTTISSTDILTDDNRFKSASVSKDDSLIYDLGNLTAFDYNALDLETYEQKTAREEYIFSLGRDNTQLLFNHIFDLPTESIKGEVGRLAILPELTTTLPREKHVPKPKEPTRWEKFAKQKGIHKTKKGRMVWDETQEKYAPRWGYQRANDAGADWAMEHKNGEDPNVDPWTRLKQEKKDRIAKNEKQQQKNLKQAKGSRVPGTIDLTSAVNVSHKGKQFVGIRESKQKPKNHVDVALGVVQTSTASMGLFDKKRAKEPELKNKAPKQYAHTLRSEKKQSMSVLDRVLGKTADESENFNSKKAAGKLQQQQQTESKQNGKGKKRGASSSSSKKKPGSGGSSRRDTPNKKRRT